MKGLLKILPTVALVLAGTFQAGFSQSTDPVFLSIKEGNIEKIEEWLSDHDINSLLGEQGTTVLVYSILNASPSTTSWLIEKGADVNLQVGNLSPLMYAAGTNDVRKIHKLLEAGANIEALDPDDNTALFYAATNPNTRIIKHLVKRGNANVLHKNESWHTAYDWAVKSSNHEVAAYLRLQFEKNLPDYRDGPYVKWKRKHRIKARYIVHDSKSQITRKINANYKADSDPFSLVGFAGDTLEYLIHSRKEVRADLVEEAERVMVIGDIHGGYDSLVLFLQNNGVINGSLKWTWGEGHLVFVGDIFDRGEKVTEALWLIYHLEDQAEFAGGAVHLILGNHEALVLSGNLNYVSDKYSLMSSKLNINYSHHFSKQSVLGQWLRTKNTIIRINGHLFVHAGLSPEIVECGLTIHEINNTVRFFLNHPERQEYKNISRNKLMGHYGPFWYRGYIKGNHDYDHLPESEFEKVLAYFGAKYIFVGHTNVKEITPLYGNRLFALDVPFYSYGNPIQGLLLEREDIFVLNSSADKIRLK